MDHSLHTYLEQLPLLKLENLLQELRSGADGANYSKVIPMIEEILKTRKDNDAS